MDRRSRAWIAHGTAPIQKEGMQIRVKPHLLVLLPLPLTLPASRFGDCASDDSFSLRRMICADLPTEVHIEQAPEILKILQGKFVYAVHFKQLPSSLDKIKSIETALSFSSKYRISGLFLKRFDKMCHSLFLISYKAITAICLREILHNRIYHFACQLAHNILLALDPDDLGSNIAICQFERPVVGITAGISRIQHIKGVGRVEIVA